MRKAKIHARRALLATTAMDTTLQEQRFAQADRTAQLEQLTGISTHALQVPMNQKEGRHRPVIAYPAQPLTIASLKAPPFSQPRFLLAFLI